MRIQLLGLMAAMTVLAACDTTPTNTNTGTSTASTPTTSAPSTSLADELKTQVGDRVLFAYDKSDISPEARAILTRQAAFMQKYPSATFTIEGHCDQRGTREYNLALGERRATSAKNGLVALGVAGGRLQTISYGKERPAVVGNNDAAYAQNRRAVTVVN
ncbi:MAG TPA: peptidoglycan-associated lipoprotein Pal [Aliidongia sp.]|uniref:peptidoglycan-associated lipoprotein Pal n=1 Tax=Aliidongia sp. TaxID=1914230 RepID=UPI002DDCC617|nr:peptidoglycan-associated lipoprotein Pal [Aliidongia sp.]HEV2676627.1 peptidoglycan-associated lipoprotein Pal [Aliidongia sp.]